MISKNTDEHSACAVDGCWKCLLRKEQVRERKLGISNSFSLLQLYKLNISCLLGFFGFGFLLIQIFIKCLPNAMHWVGCLRDTEILTEAYSLAGEANT